MFRGIPCGTERDIEVPYIYNYLLDYIMTHHNPKILEIGNVCSNHFNVYSLGGEYLYDIIDLYEVNGLCINEDIRYYRSDILYDLIISISTLEHIGEVEKDSRYGIIDALLNIKGLLVSGGICIFTVPVNYQKEMDFILDQITIFDRVIFMKRISDTEWVETDREGVSGGIYSYPYLGANELRICWVR